MQVTNIKLSNWLCHVHLDVALSPLTVVCGPNHSGKSAILDAVAFALIGELRRVKMKGDRAQLLTEGAKAGTVHVTFSDGRVARDVATGKTSSDNVFAATDYIPSALPFVLDRERFCRVEANERRLLLQDVMRVDLGPAGLLRTLYGRGHTKELLERLKPGASVSDWLEQAERGAAEARGAWKAITGAVYGSEKARAWEAPQPIDPPDNRDVQAAAAKLATLQESLRALQVQSGVQTTNAARDKREQEQMAAWSRLSDTLGDEKARLDAAELAVKDAVAASEKTAEALQLALDEGGDGSTLACPDCGIALALHDGRLIIGQPGKRAAAEIEALMKASRAANVAASLANQRHENSRQRVIAATAARMSRDRAREETGTPAELAVTPAMLEAQITDMQSEVKAATSAADMLTIAYREAQRSADQTAKAAGYHRAVQAWVALRDALQPDGVPGEMLTSALGPFNDSLRLMASENGWPQVTLTPEMDVEFGGRAHGLLSRSERWRADATLAVTLAMHSGIRMVALDEFDVLDVASRGSAMGWLYGLTKDALDTVIVLATLKTAPPVPSDVSVIWLGTPSSAPQAEAA